MVRPFTAVMAAARLENGEPGMGLPFIFTEVLTWACVATARHNKSVETKHLMANLCVVFG